MLAATVAELLLASFLSVMHVDTLEKDVREPAGFRCCVVLLRAPLGVRLKYCQGFHKHIHVQ
jgi:hypothetical protein